METLKSKILKPFFFVIILLPVSICLILNLTIKIYSSNNAKKELMEVANNVGEIFKSIYENTQEYGDNNSEKNFQTIRNFEIVRASIQASQFYDNTEMFLLLEDGSVITSEGILKNQKITFINDEIIKLSMHFLSETQENEIKTFELGVNEYHALYKIVPETNNIVVYISSGHYIDKFIKIINIVLIFLCSFFTMIALFYSNKIAKSLSTPIVDLSKKVEKFNSGDIIDTNELDDCLEIKNLKNSINKMSTRLFEYDLAQKSFLLNASHELRTPLMSISGYAEGIEKGIFDNPKEMAGIILEESMRLNVLVDKLLTLSRIENNVLNFEQINLSNILKEFVQKVQGYAICENIDIKLDITDENLVVFVDESVLAQAVINILSNSIRYAKNEVQIEIFKSDDFAIIRIKDDGEGIKIHDLPYIFNRFYKGKDGNLGLGLSISKTAIDYMKGKIRAYNKDGAVFEIKFKLC
ncbi:MAG: HAMP domain-containing sensor histidine kinase [Clostridia bacterium]